MIPALLLATAVADHRAALEARPWDAAVQRSLEAVRARVPYPTPPDPRLRVRPAPPAGLRHRVGPHHVLTLSTLGAGLLAVGLIARRTVRPAWAGPTSATGGIVLIGVGALSLGIRPPADGWRVVAEPTPLRAGNAASYPVRVPLPAGAEVRELLRRGAWVQVEVAGGAAGWVPAAALLPADR